MCNVSTTTFTYRLQHHPPHQDDLDDVEIYLRFEFGNMRILKSILSILLLGFRPVSDHMNITQHGFRGRLSCITQLLHYFDSILSMLEEGEQVDVADRNLPESDH